MSKRPDSALDAEGKINVPTATKPTPAPRPTDADLTPPAKASVARRVWPAELALYLTLLLVGLCLACIFGSKGLSEVAAIDRAASALSNGPSSFGPVRSAGIVAAVFGPILAAVSLICAASLAFGARALHGAGGGWAPRTPTLPLAVLTAAALWSAFMLAACTGALAYSSALQTSTTAATALYDKAAKLVHSADLSTVRAVDTLGGALPFGRGLINSAFAALQGRPSASAGAGTALEREVKQFSTALGLSPAASNELLAAKQCPSACLDLSFIPFLADTNKCVCDGAALVSIAARARRCVADFKTAVAGGALLTLAHVLMAARGGVWAGALGAP